MSKLKDPTRFMLRLSVSYDFFQINGFSIRFFWSRSVCATYDDGLELLGHNVTKLQNSLNLCDNWLCSRIHRCLLANNSLANNFISNHQHITI